MNKLTVFILVVTAALAFAASTPPDINKHAPYEIECEDCHRDSPDQEPSYTICIDCHGDYPEMAAFTDKYDRNPHVLHEPNDRGFPCTSCHAMHTESYNFCEICHDVAFSVP